MTTSQRNITCQNKNVSIIKENTSVSDCRENQTHLGQMNQTLALTYGSFKTVFGNSWELF